MRVVIASVVAPTYIGGLAGYQRVLSEALDELSEVEISTGCVYAKHPELPQAGNDGARSVCSAIPLVSLRIWRRWLPWFGRLAARPYCHALLQRVTSFVLPASRLEERCGRFDAIHFVGTGWDMLGFSLMAAARKRRARFSVCPAVHPGSWGDDKVDIRLYNQADAVMCFTDHERIHLNTMGVPAAKLMRCGLPPMCRHDGDKRRFREAYALNQRPTVLFIGRRDEGKGYPALLQAWPHVLRCVPDACLVVAGPGGAEFTSQLTSLPGESVRDIGVPNEQEKSDALAGCDVFCLPSAHESFGIVYVEAWSYSKPVICGPAPACRELVESSGAGVSSTQDPTALAHSICMLLGDPVYAERMGERGRQYQQAVFSKQQIVASHLRAFGAPEKQPVSRD